VAEDLSSGRFHRAERRIDVRRLDQPKTEVSDSSRKASLGWPLFKNEHVARAGCLRLNKAVFLVDRDDPEYFLVELQRTFGISNRKSDVCQTVCSDRAIGLTGISSAAASESERELQWTCCHKVKRGSTPASEPAREWVTRSPRASCII
jgi:hypothetical protein